MTKNRKARADRALKGRRLIDEHDRYAIPDRIPKRISVADKARFRLAIFELTLALRADEYFEKCCVKTHLACSLAM